MVAVVLVRNLVPFDLPAGWDISLVALMERTGGFAVTTAMAQVLVGLILAVGLERLRNRFLDRSDLVYRLLLSVLVAIYTLHPLVVHDLWANYYSFTANSDFALLSLAAIWQYAPFAMLFFIAAFQTVTPQAKKLVRLETRSHLYRFIQVAGAWVIRIGLLLLALRFLWMFSKFDLPYTFLADNDSSEQLLATMVGRDGLSPNEVFYWAALMFVAVMPLAMLVFIGRAVLQGERRSSGWLNATVRDVGRRIEKVLPATLVTAVERVRVALSHLLVEPRFSRFLDRVTSMVSIGTVFLFVATFVHAASLYLPALGMIDPSSVAARFPTSVAVTITLCSVTAIVAGLIGAFIGYVARRFPDQALITTWERGTVLVYALPIVILSLFAKRAYNAVEGVAKLYRSYLYGSFGQSGNVGGLVDILSVMPEAIVSGLSYVAFSVPFCLLLLYAFFGNQGSRRREEQALVDGTGRGWPIIGHALKNEYRGALGLVVFIAFVIHWQDVSVALRFKDLPLLAGEFEELTGESGTTEAAAFGIGFAVSVALGTGFYFLQPYLHVLLRGNGRGR